MDELALLEEMFALFSENLTEHIIISSMWRSLMLKKVIYAVTTLLYRIQTCMKTVLQTKSGEINFSLILSPSPLSPKQYLLYFVENLHRVLCTCSFFIETIFISVALVSWPFRY